MILELIFVGLAHSAKQKMDYRILENILIFPIHISYWDLVAMALLFQQLEWRWYQPILRIKFIRWNNTSDLEDDQIYIMIDINIFNKYM